MQYEIDTSTPRRMDWNSKGDKRVVQNVQNLLSTWRYEVAYDRTKGLHPAILDLPQNDAIALYTAEVYRLVETYEPRATVVSVNFVQVDPEGNIQLKVVIDV